MSRHVAPSRQLPLTDAVGDTGKFVGAILAEPDRYEGKKFCAATALYSMEEIVAAMSKVTGQTVVYRQISTEEFKKSLPLEASVADMFVECFDYQEKFGYYGPRTEELVAWAGEDARGGRRGLANFERYLEAHPLRPV